MPDIAIDYELLHQLGRETEVLHHRIDEARKENHHYRDDEVGREAAPAVSYYYQRWNAAFKNAGDLLDSLSKTYTSVAQQWFDQDAAYAAVANEEAAGIEHASWEMRKSAYDNWKKLSETYVTVHGYDENGHPYERRVPLADPGHPPESPGEEPTGYSYTAGDGSEHITKSTYDGNGNLTSTDTIVHNHDGGLSYHETTTFNGNGGYTVEVIHADGSTTSQAVTENGDGTGTRTDVYTGPNGETTTKTYTGQGLDGDNPVWTETTPENQDGDPGHQGDNVSHIYK